MFDLINGSYFYFSPEDDIRQDLEVGDFRARCISFVSHEDSVLEIGGGYSPLFKRQEGFNVKTLDHLPTEELINKYKGMNVDTSFIEKVDYVYGGEDLRQLTKNDLFKFVFASHVIEHSPNFIRFLNGCLDILDERGAIILLVPDKRYCFDFFQPITDCAKVLADYLQNKTTHSFESFYREEMQAAVKINNLSSLTWWQREIPELHFMHRDPIARYESALAKGNATEYHDAHEYFFTPASFTLIIEELNFLGLLPIRISLLTRARGCEFMTVLTKASPQRLTGEEFFRLKLKYSIAIKQEEYAAYSLLKDY